MGETSCDSQGTIAVADAESSDRVAEATDCWAWIWLPVELVEIVWEQIPFRVRALLSKEYYSEWREAQFAERPCTRRGRLDMGRLIRRQVRMNHQYTFGVLLDMRGKSWSQMRPWRVDGDKFASFLWYLESVCAQEDRHEMRSLVRHAIDRHEGPASTARKGRKQRGKRSYQRMGGIRERDWISFA